MFWRPLIKVPLKSLCRAKWRLHKAPPGIWETCSISYIKSTYFAFSISIVSENGMTISILKFTNSRNILRVLAYRILFFNEVIMSCFNCFYFHLYQCHQHFFCVLCLIRLMHISLVKLLPFFTVYPWLYQNTTIKGNPKLVIKATNDFLVRKTFFFLKFCLSVTRYIFSCPSSQSPAMLFHTGNIKKINIPRKDNKNRVPHFKTHS